MEPDQRSHQKVSFPLLVVEDNEDQQLVICYCLRAKIPQAEPVFAATAQETLSYLKSSFALQRDIPRLVFLDLSLPDLTDGFTLLSQLRTQYPLLPVIILSSQSEPVVINKSYQLGAHSFLAKPQSLDEWEILFQSINEYWLGTVTLSRYVLTI